MYFMMNVRGDVFQPSIRFHEDTLENYNCGGYALGLYEWYMPFVTPYKAENCYDEALDEADYYEDEDNSKDAQNARKNLDYWYNKLDDVIDGFRDLYCECFNTIPGEDDEEFLGEWDSDDAVELAVFIMLRQFNWLRRIDSWDDLKDDEYGIIFGVGHGDFHFIRYDDGVYTHKMGGGEIETVEKWEEAFYCSWMKEMRYNLGHIFFAAKKEGYR